MILAVHLWDKGFGALCFKLRDKGWDHQQIVEWVENNKLRIAHWFTVDDSNT